MKPKINFINEINNDTMQWNLKVRIVRLWHIPDRYKPDNPFTVEMVLQDEKGDRIQATIGRSVMRTFKSKISELGLYFIKNILVGPNDAKFKSTQHKFKLTFTQRTTVEEIDDPQFDLSIFTFRPYEHFISGENVDLNELFDVIGQVVSYSNVKTFKQGANTSVFMEVELQDHKKNKLSTTFWGEFVDQILPYLTESSEQPIIVVMQLIRPHKFQEKYSVRNTWHISKLYINSNLPQVTDFKERLLAAQDHSSIVISQISSQDDSIVEDELASGNLAIKSIRELVDCQHEQSFWIMATIIYLDLAKGWSYVACKMCTKGVDNIQGIIKCKKCDRADPPVVIRYRIKVRVFDNSGYIGLLLWDNEAAKLVGKTAKELKERLIENSAAALDYPIELDSIVERKVMFKVLVKSDNIKKQDEVYTILKVCEDEDVLKKYDRPTQDVSYTNPDFNNEQVMDEDKELTGSTADNDMISLTKTPAKRTRVDGRFSVQEIDDDVNAQSSSNRVKQVIKKEKK